MRAPVPLGSRHLLQGRRHRARQLRIDERAIPALYLDAIAADALAGGEAVG